MFSKGNNENKSIPLLQAFFVFLILTSFLFLVASYYDFTNVNLGVLSFIVTLISIVLLTKIIYDLSLREEEMIETFNKISDETVNNPPKKLFAEVFNNSPIAYLIINKNGFIKNANKSAIRLFGRSQFSLVMDNFFSYIDVNSSEHLVLIREKFRNGVSVNNEEVQISKGTGLSWVLLSIFTFVNSTGERMSLVTLLDVTKQKEIDIAKSEFVSLASHQLRTPITGMRWSAELLLIDGSENLNPQQRRYLDRLILNIQKMASLVDDFLQVSRFDLGTRIIETSSVVVDKVLDEILSEYAFMTSNKNLKIIRKFDYSKVKSVNTDENLFKMIMTNIIGNAIKYSRDGGELEIRYTKEEDNLVFEIRDEGIGIPVSEQSKIFSKIFRASNALREVPDGTGLGLYIAKKSVQSLRGRISFISEENIGTTFTIVIPSDLTV